jgi:hypothetical protein
MCRVPLLGRNSCERWVLYTRRSANTYVSLTTALNLFWGLLAAIAFGFYARGHACRGPRLRHGHTRRRFPAMAIVVLALFPCISASDDVVGYGRLTSKNQPDSSVEDPVSAQLTGVLLSLEQIQVREVFTLVLTLSLFELVTFSCFEIRGQRLPTLPGRAPPIV